MTDTIDIIEQLRRENAALKRELASLRTLSFEDPVTGLKNRRYFETRLVTELDRAERHDERLSVVVVDVDDFKRVNDSFGHEVGDRLLRWVAVFLANNVREHDVVCRTGGDEFALILPSADAAGVAQLIDRLHRSLDHAHTGLGDYRVGLSLGAATWHDGYRDLRAFIADADLAMYRDKLARKRGAQARTPTAGTRPAEAQPVTWN